MGRISETGKLLHSEPKYWTLINLAFLVFFFVTMFYNLTILSEKNDAKIFEAISNFILLLGLFVIIKFFHSILFIPDKASSYIEVKDKFAKEFKIKYITVTI